MLHDDISYGNMTNEIKVYTRREFRNCDFSYIFLNWNISVTIGANLIKFGTHVVKAYSEGTVSQIFFLDPSFYFMNSRKLCWKKKKKLPDFLHKTKTRT